MEIDEEYLDEVMRAAKAAWAQADKYTRYRGLNWGDLAPIMDLPMDSEAPEVTKLNRALHMLADDKRLSIDRSTQPDRFKPRKRAR